MQRRGSNRSRPLADLVAPVLGPAMAAQGFSGSDVVASWSEIVGEHLGRVSRPIKVEWPRRRDAGERTQPATLVVRVEGAFALDLQHLAPLLLERINAIYGWRCIGRIVLKQGPVGGTARAARPRVVPLSQADRERVRAAARALSDEPLRRAVERLGCAIASRPDPEAAALLNLATVAVSS